MTSDTPSSDFPPETPQPPAHRAPMRDTRPRSGWALWTLLLTVLLGVVGFLTYSPAAVIPAMVIGVVALVKIKPQWMRGQVMVIVSLIMAALVGSCSYMFAKSTHDVVDHIGGGVLGALGSDEPDRVDKWIAPEAREAGAADLFRERFAKVVEAYGPFQGELILPSRWIGGVTIAEAPTDIEEIGGGIGEAWAPRTGPLWCRAVFRDGEVHLELYLGASMAEGFAKAIEATQGKTPAPVLHDLRFFKDK